ncbi:hypothetical protein [Amorphus sp. 3PC139-8]|uniref:hypothetical protein n=1 Tax=Amorphus sp. 3PC139-8 TaxID=2735676 RepID=UPI00345CDF0E
MTQRDDRHPTINREARLYVFPCGSGYSCLGFDVAERRMRAVAAWLGKHELPPHPAPGSPEHLAAYLVCMEAGQAHHAATGARCPAELSPALRGHEGWRVEVTEADGNRRRFIVGKSTGWMPCHLEVARRDSSGGPAAFIPEGATVRPLHPVHAARAA